MAHQALRTHQVPVLHTAAHRRPRVGGRLNQDPTHHPEPRGLAPHRDGGWGNLLPEMRGLGSERRMA